MAISVINIPFYNTAIVFLILAACILFEEVCHGSTEKLLVVSSIIFILSSSYFSSWYPESVFIIAIICETSYALMTYYYGNGDIYCVPVIIPLRLCFFLMSHIFNLDISKTTYMWFRRKYFLNFFRSEEIIVYLPVSKDDPRRMTDADMLREFEQIERDCASQDANKSLSIDSSKSNKSDFLTNSENNCPIPNSVQSYYGSGVIYSSGMRTRSFTSSRQRAGNAPNEDFESFPAWRYHSIPGYWMKKMACVILTDVEVSKTGSFRQVNYMVDKLQTLPDELFIPGFNRDLGVWKQLKKKSERSEENKKLPKWASTYVAHFRDAYTQFTARLRAAEFSEAYRKVLVREAGMNDSSARPVSVSYLPTCVIRAVGRTGKPFFSVEQYIPGKYTKWSSNRFVDSDIFVKAGLKDDEILHTFSHWYYYNIIIITYVLLILLITTTNFTTTVHKVPLHLKDT